MLRFHRTAIILLTFFLYELRSRMLCAHWMVMCSRLAYSYVFLMSHVPGSCTCMFPVPFHMLPLLYRFGLTTHLCLRFLLMLTPFVSSTRYSWTMTHDMTRLPFTNVCTCMSCISPFTIYMVGDGDSSLIFNLLCNHPTSVNREIPRTLSFPSSSLVKATALRF